MLNLHHHNQIIAEAYSGDVEAFKLDNVRDCAWCRQEFFCGFMCEDMSAFDPDIRNDDGVNVCNACAPIYLEEQIDAMRDQIRERRYMMGVML